MEYPARHICMVGLVGHNREVLQINTCKVYPRTRSKHPMTHRLMVRFHIRVNGAAAARRAANPIPYTRLPRDNDAAKMDL